MQLLAIHEAALPTGTRFINQALVDKFPDRTLESIKGIRKSKNIKYHAILESVKEHRPVTPRRRLLPATPSTANSNLINNQSTVRSPSTNSINVSLNSSTSDLLATEISVEDQFEISISTSAKVDPTLESLVTRLCNNEDIFPELSTLMIKRHFKKKE